MVKKAIKSTSHDKQHKKMMDKNPMMGEKAMPVMASGKSAKSMMKQEATIEKKTAKKPKTTAEKKLEQKISKATGKPYKGKR